MPLSTPTVRNPKTVQPLLAPDVDHEVIERAGAVGRRLAGELRAVVNALPSEDRRIRAMASRLGVNRNICQRVLKAIRAGQDGSNTLLALPGVEGLLKFSRAAARCGFQPGKIESLEAAIEQFASLIQECGGSHARLQTLLETASRRPVGVAGDGASSSQVAIREYLFEGTSAMLGSAMDAHALITAIRPVPGDAARVEVAGLTGFVGQRLQPNAQPLTVAYSNFSSGTDASLPGYQELVQSELSHDASMVDELCSQPAPKVTSRRGKNSIVHMIDPAPADRKTPFTVAIGNRVGVMDNPALNDLKVFNVAARIRNPTRRLIFDVYLHRSLAAASVPSIAAFLWHPALSEDPAESWHERLPDDNHVAILGRGVHNAASDAWDKHADATQRLFRSLNWPPDEYVAHRIDVAYPIWGAWYVFSADFHTDFEP